MSAAVMDKRWYPGKPPDAMTIWVNRGGNGRTSNSGPSGRLLRPAAVRYRALAEMAATHRAARGVRRRAA